MKGLSSKHLVLKETRQNKTTTKSENSLSLSLPPKRKANKNMPNFLEFAMLIIEKLATFKLASHRWISSIALLIHWFQ